MPAAKLLPILSGVAGEYYVAAELSRRGIIASISLRNTRGVDILATNESATRTVTIQVKTNQTRQREWLVSEKSESITSETHFYVFVNLGELSARPDFYIVPNVDVVAFAKKNHAEWLGAPSPSGRPRNDSSMRKFKDADGSYLEKWDLLRF